MPLPGPDGRAFGPGYPHVTAALTLHPSPKYTLESLGLLEAGAPSWAGLEVTLTGDGKREEDSNLPACGHPFGWAEGDQDVAPVRIMSFLR